MPREHRHLGPPAAVAVRERPEAVLPDRLGLRPREARPAAELRQVAHLALSLVRLAFLRPCILMRGCKLSLDNVGRGR